MLLGLVRVSLVARMLGVCQRTARRWLASEGIHVAAQPVADHGRIGGTNAPLYVSMEGAVRLVDRLLPRKVERLASARLRQAAGKARRALEESTRNLRHEQVGGTGLEAPTQKPPL